LKERPKLYAEERILGSSMVPYIECQGHHSGTTATLVARTKMQEAAATRVKIDYLREIGVSQVLGNCTVSGMLE